MKWNILRNTCFLGKYLVLMDAHFQMSYVELVQKHKLIFFRIKYITEI